MPRNVSKRRTAVKKKIADKVKKKLTGEEVVKKKKSDKAPKKKIRKPVKKKRS